MAIPPSTIIMLCDNTPSVAPQIDGHALAKAYKNGSFRTRIYETEYYLAFAANTKPLFNDEEYLGGIITIRHKGEKIQSSLEQHAFFMHGEAVVINATPDSILLTPAGGKCPILIWDKDNLDEIKQQFMLAYSTFCQDDPLNFESNWGRFVANKPIFHYYSGRLTF